MSEVRFTSRRRWFGTLLLAAGFALGTTSPVAGGPIPGDGVPSGTVAFFATGASCPGGWIPATNVEGRLVVGVTDAANVGATVGAPLADREDRSHQHAWSGQVTLTSRSIAAANGSNVQGAAAGAYDVAGITETATTGLPFVQMRPCRKQ